MAASDYGPVAPGGGSVELKLIGLLLLLHYRGTMLTSVAGTTAAGTTAATANQDRLP